MTFLSVSYSVLVLFKKEDTISGSVFNILLIALLVNCTAVPVLAWIDTPKFVQYLHKWEQFQVGNNSVSDISASTENNQFFDLIYFSSMTTENRKKA